MSIQQMLAVGDGRALVSSADFDGSNTYLNRGANLTGVSDDKLGTVSFWFRVDGGDGTLMHIMTGYASGNYAMLSVQRLANNTFAIASTDPSDFTNPIWVFSTTGYTSSVLWHHFLASWDLNSALGHLYIDDVNRLATSPWKYLNNEPVRYSQAINWTVGGWVTSFRFNGCLAEQFLKIGSYLDLSVELNRRKFITKTLKPAFLGLDGSLPFGSAPNIYQRLRPGDAASAFATNRGTGGDFSVVGSLTAGSSSPSD